MLNIDHVSHFVDREQTPAELEAATAEMRGRHIHDFGHNCATEAEFHARLDSEENARREVERKEGRRLEAAVRQLPNDLRRMLPRMREQIRRRWEQDNGRAAHARTIASPRQASPRAIESRAPRRREHRSSGTSCGPPDDDDPSSDDDDESSIGGATGQSVSRPRSSISSPAPITISDVTCLAVLGMEPRFFRRFVVEHSVPHVKLHRRTIAKVADILSAFDRLAGIAPATSAESGWSAESVVAAACGGLRGGR